MINSKYPFLLKLAEIVLACPPCQTTTECVFSKVKNRSEDVSNRISNSNLSKMLFIKENLKFIRENQLIKDLNLFKTEENEENEQSLKRKREEAIENQVLENRTKMIKRFENKKEIFENWLLKRAVQQEIKEEKVESLLDDVHLKSSPLEPEINEDQEDEEIESKSILQIIGSKNNLNKLDASVTAFDSPLSLSSGSNEKNPNKTIGPEKNYPISDYGMLDNFQVDTCINKIIKKSGNCKYTMIEGQKFFSDQLLLEWIAKRIDQKTQVILIPICLRNHFFLIVVDLISNKSFVLDNLGK